MALKNLLEERAQVCKEMRGILEQADKESKGVLNAEQRAKYDELFNKQEDLKEAADRAKRQEDLERDLSNPIEERASISKAVTVSDSEREERHERAFNAFLRGGMSGLTAEQTRDLSSTNLVQGGALVAPQKFLNEVIKAVDNQVFLRQLGRVFSLDKAVSMGAPTFENDVSDAEWTTELGSGTADSSLSFGKRELSPNYFVKKVLVPTRLLEHSVINVDSLIAERVAYKHAVTEEKAFLTGSGAGQALGLFTAHANGIPTSRDYSTDNTSSAITFDNLKGVIGNQKNQYLRKCRWLFSRQAKTMLSKIKDTTNQYIWEQSVQVGEPDLLLGYPLVISEYVPNTFTTGLYVGLFGDFSYYWIAEEKKITIQRLVELYAATNHIGFHTSQAVDGMPVMPEAFTRVKLG